MSIKTKIVSKNETNVEQIVETKEVTIHDKYDKYVQQARSNYLTNINYFEIMEMVNYIQLKTNRNYPINITCADCVLQMVKLFDRLR